MKNAFVNGIILDGTKNMEAVSGKAILVDNDKIVDIVDVAAVPSGYKKIDLAGAYIMPGLINMHVHLAGNGKPDMTPRDNAALVKKIMSTALTRYIAYNLVAKFAKIELMSGVTTIRTVGGLGDLDTRVRDAVNKGRRIGPRILASNEGISVPGGHMAGSVAVAVNSPEEAVEQVRKAKEGNTDLIKLMVTGGVLDAKEKGTPGELKMAPEIIKAACEEAHKLGYIVAAHTESPEGVRVSLENGVDSIEHGAVMDEDTLRLYKEKKAFVCTTISPALPFALFDPESIGISEKDRFNGDLVFRGIVEGAKEALRNDIPVALGNDVGCPYITQYDFWRELVYFQKYCEVSNAFALHTATELNAKLAGVGDITGSIIPGKHADMIVTRENPLDSLTALRQLEMVIRDGKIIRNPKVKKNPIVEAALDKYL